MSDLELHIKNFSSKFHQLLKQYRSLQKENEQLLSVVKELKEVNVANTARIDQLKQQTAILKTAAGSMNEEEKKAFEKNINQYIREIDKCIALLSE